MRRAAAVFVLSIVVGAACLAPSGTLFETTVTMPDGSYPMPVALRDQTGLVVAIEPALDESAAGKNLFVGPDPADPRSVLVTWFGGACDNDVAMSLTRAEGIHFLFLDTHGKLGLGCPALGLTRGVAIRFSEPIPVNTIQARLSP